MKETQTLLCKLKKVSLLIFSIVFIFSLVGCGENNVENYQEIEIDGPFEYPNN